MNWFVVGFLVVLCSLSIKHCSAANILMLFPSPSRSHLIIAQALTIELAKRGHKITEFSSFPLEKPQENYRHIEIPYENIMEEMLKESVNDSAGKFFKQLKHSFGTSLSFLKSGNDTIHHPKLKQIVKEEKVDLIITGFFMNTFLLGIAEELDCPAIVVSVQPPMSLSNALVGNPLCISGVRSLMGYKNLETFFGRVRNVISYGFELMLMNYVESKSKNLYEENFPADKYVSYNDALKRVSLVLTNHHFSQGSVRPNVPAMIEVGGLQVKTIPNPLPEHIKKFMDEAEHGVIFFSLGSNAKSIFLPQAKVNILIKAFSKLKQRIVWKWETDELPGKPDNVLIGKWLPQDDILAHPNTKMFISHGGLGSVVESMYHGVPIVGMALFGDQMANIQTVVRDGWAVSVDPNILTEESITDAIQEVLQNPKYSNTVKKLSEIYRDRPATALETAVYWTEYVIRHKGAKHLRYPAADLNFFQYYSLDVFAFIFTTFYIFLKIAKFVIQIVKRKRSKHVKFDMHLKKN